MGRKPQVQTRLPNDTYDRLTEYQEKRGISQSEATRRLIESGLDAEAEKEPIPDGGYLTRSEHPWVDPLINLGYESATIGMYALFVSTVAILIPSGAIQWFGANLSGETAALFLSLFTLGAITGTALIAISMLALLALEYLMHPSEAPFRRYFWTPEDTAGEVVSV